MNNLAHYEHLRIKSFFICLLGADNKQQLKNKGAARAATYRKEK